jgi:exonuclease III
VISSWADSIIKNNSNHNLIIVGDFNDTPVRKKNPTLTPLLKNKSLFFLTESLKSCKYPSWFVIDHIIVSENMLQYYEENSLFIYNFREKFPDYSLKLLSDHCPISASFNFGK